MRRFIPLFVVLGALVIAAGWWLVYYSPGADDVTRVRDETAELEREKQALDAQLAQLEELAKRPESEAFRDLLSELIPQQADLEGFISTANRVAQEAGVEWISVAPTPPAVGSGGGPSVIALAIQIEGRFRTITDYLNRLDSLEEFRRLVVIDSVSISASEGGTTGGSSGGSSTTSSTVPSATGSPTLQVTLTGRMFTFQPLAGTAPADGSTPTTSSSTPTSVTPSVPTSSSNPVT